MRKILSFFLLLLLPVTPALAWNEHGHRVIASMTFQRLEPNLRLSIANKIRKHPRWEQDFESKMPEIVKTGDEQTQAEWIFQQACVWPDMARGFQGEDKKKYNHGNWHWADKVIYLNDGDKEAVGELDINQSTEPPAEATEEMNVVQTIEYAKLRISGKVEATEEEIALMYCWLLHCYSDLHQPCHTTALVSQGLFPKGDAGANRIPTKQSRNMHALWDGLLGAENGFESCRNEAAKQIEIAEAKKLVIKNPVVSHTDTGGLWKLGHDMARNVVYSDEVVAHLKRLEESRAAKATEIDLSKQYLQLAGIAAKIQSLNGAYRMKLLLEDLEDYE